MRVVFMGSAEFACPILRNLTKCGVAEVTAVVTQPDKPSGRGLEMSSSDVRKCATDLNIPSLTPANVNLPDSLDAIRAFQPDLIVVVAYGQILKAPLLALPPMGCINIHASLLPHYRGAAPIQWAIANGDKVTGVTAMHMNERMDAGDIILQKEVPIDREDTAANLHDRLAEQGATALIEVVHAINAGHALRVPQNEADATYAPKLSKQDGRIAWTASAEQIYNRIRGFNPWPTCYCQVSKEPGRHRPGTGGKTEFPLKVLKARIEEGRAGKPGEIVDVTGDGPLVRTGDGSIRLVEVQPEGRKVMSGQAFLNGHKMRSGEILG
jgi:methionyl-tRNA formyltransferase